MRAPRFWWMPSSLTGMLLSPIGMLYGAISAWRMKQRGYHADLPVICVGNLVAGGAGKTPTAIWLATSLQAKGLRPVFLTRGFGGAEAGPILVDLSRHTAHEIGDEAPLLARVAPTLVARDRVAGAKLAHEYGNIIIMDDGLQNPSLEKDVALAVIDRNQGVGNGRVMPAGPLRAPLRTQLEKIDACLLIGDRTQNDYPEQQFRKPIFFGRLKPHPQDVKKLQGQNLFAFAGIGRPQKFFDTLAALGAYVKKSESFPDHHVYSRQTLENLLNRADAEGCTCITTAKDLARIQAIAPHLAQRISVLNVTLECDEGEAMIALIIDRIKTKRILTF